MGRAQASGVLDRVLPALCEWGDMMHLDKSLAVIRNERRGSAAFDFARISGASPGDSDDERAAFVNQLLGFFADRLFARPSIAILLLSTAQEASD